jgi:hypothetical protein
MAYDPGSSFLHRSYNYNLGNQTQLCFYSSYCGDNFDKATQRPPPVDDRMANMMQYYGKQSEMRNIEPPPLEQINLENYPDNWVIHTY